MAVSGLAMFNSRLSSLVREKASASLHARDNSSLVSDDALWEEQDACEDAGNEPDDADVREDVEVLLHDGVRHPRAR